MKKLLFFVWSLFAIVSMTNAQPIAQVANDKGTNDMWDFVTSFVCATGRQYGVACDGEYIYTSVHSYSSTVTSMFFKYDLDGNMVESFDIEGCDFLRDLTYDGQYFYGGNAEEKFYCVDLANKTVISETTTQCPELRHCTYDPVNDGFWVGNSRSLQFMDRNGQITMTVHPFIDDEEFCKGTGYFTDENGEAHLYLFCNSGFNGFVRDYNITTNTMNPNQLLDFTTTPGFSLGGSAGGAFIGEYKGTTCFFGDSEQSPNLIGIYALGDSPLPPTPPTPTDDLFYDFNDGIMRWTAIDADNDGYNWEMRRNWGNSSNPWSVTSCSNYMNVSLQPDNYLISPLQGPYHKITFRACAQDATYCAEHFGIAVSTQGNTDPADFTTVWEATMTAKDPGAWYEYSVDLSQFNGQNIWVAIRHFNCKDQFYLNVDDVALLIKPESVAEASGVSVAMYPNPTNGAMMISCEETIRNYEIYNVMGALVRQESVEAKSFKVNVSDLSAGSYVIRMSTDEAVLTKRFVKE